MAVLYTVTRILMYSIEIVGISLTTNGILSSNTASLFIGILLYMLVRFFEEKQNSEKVRESILGKINNENTKESDDTFWFLLQLLIIGALIILAMRV